MLNDTLHVLERENQTLNAKVESLLDSILMKCCDCQGYSCQSKVALDAVLDCDCYCPLSGASRGALSILWGFPKGEGMR